MELTELGLDSGLAEQASQLCGSGQRLARVTAVDRGRYVVRINGESTGSDSIDPAGGRFGEPAHGLCEYGVKMKAALVFAGLAVVLGGISPGTALADEKHSDSPTSGSSSSSQPSRLRDFEKSVPFAVDANKPARQEVRHGFGDDKKPDESFNLVLQLFVDVLRAAGERSMQRVSSSYAEPDDSAPLAPRADGSPLLPFIRYDFALQRASGDISAHINRVEGGYGPVGIYLEDYSFFENSTQNTLDIKRQMLLYRMAGEQIEIDLGVGQAVMTGGRRTEIDAYSLRSRIRVNENFTIDFQPVWGSGLDDYELALSYGRQFGAFKFGYRSLRSPSATLDGFFAGLSVYY